MAFICNDNLFICGYQFKNKFCPKTSFLITFCALSEAKGMDISMEKKLVTKFSPLLDSYWFYSDLLLIIRDIPNNQLWLANNYINIRGHNDISPVGVYFYNNSYRNKMVEYYDCPFIEMQKIVFDKNKLIFKKDIIDFIIESIDNGYYVLFMVDRNYINLYNFYKSDSHQIMVTGYDTKNKLMFFCDNYSTGKYKIDLYCTFDEIQKAYHAFKYFEPEPDMNTSVFLFKPKSDNNYCINLMKIKKDILLYLKGTSMDNSEEWVYGINVYTQLIEYLENAYKNNTCHKDIKSFCVLYDHKKAMYYRIKYITDLNIIKKNLLFEYEEILERSKNIIFIFLKFNITNDYKLIKKCINELKYIKNKETEILSVFVSCF